MKHIKTPVRPRGNYVMEGEAPSSHYLLKVFCEGDGNESKDVEGAVGAASEIALALNLYDDFVDVCKAQRDALGILRAAIVEAGVTLTVGQRAVYQGALLKADAVLGKVEGEGER